MARRRNNNRTPKLVVVRTVEPEALSLGWVNVAPRRDVKVHLAELDDEKRDEVWNRLLNCVENGTLEVRLVDGKQPKKKLGTPAPIEHVEGDDKLEPRRGRKTNLTGDGKNSEGPVKPDALKEEKKAAKKSKKESKVEEKADEKTDEAQDAKTEEATKETHVEENSKSSEEAVTDTPAVPPAPPAPPAPSEEEASDSTPDLNDL